MERLTTQRNRIRKHLLDGYSITQLQALQLFGCLRLSAIIYRLRHDEDLPILMDRPEACAGKPYALYRIDPDYIRSHSNT